MTSRPRRRLPKRSREETRQLMLRAGTELVCEVRDDGSDSAVSAALAHVQLTQVAARANRIVRAGVPGNRLDSDVAPITTGSIYQVWPTQADFQADLLFYIAELDAASQPIIDEIKQIMRDGIRAGESAGSTLALMINRSFEHTRNSAVFYVSLGFYIHSRNDRVASVLRHGQTAFIGAIRPVWQELLDGYEYRMRDPYTVDNLAMAISTLIEGMSLQWVRDPSMLSDPLGEPGESMVSRTAQMLFKQMTIPS